jgi:hypothetical protein
VGLFMQGGANNLIGGLTSTPGQAPVMSSRATATQASTSTATPRRVTRSRATSSA